MPDEYVDSSCTQQMPVVDLCEKCQRPWETGMFPFCKGNPLDHGERLKHSPFPSFEHEGTLVTSLEQVRRIERESMERYHGGEPGAAPLVWRDFSNDRSNRDENVFGRPSYPGKQNKPNIKLRRRPE